MNSSIYVLTGMTQPDFPLRILSLHDEVDSQKKYPKNGFFIDRCLFIEGLFYPVHCKQASTRREIHVEHLIVTEDHDNGGKKSERRPQES